MIPHKPHIDPENTQSLEQAPAGRHRMKLNRVKEGVTSPRWSGDVWEFVGGGFTIAEYVDIKTVWKYARLAKSLGDQAHREYKATDSDGNSSFNPMHYLGHEVSILVEDCVRNGEPSTRIKKIDPVGRPNDWDKQDLTPDDRFNDDPSPPSDHSAATVKDDDIPF